MFATPVFLQRISYYIKCCYNDNLDKLVVYSGENVSEQFVKSLISDVEEIYTNHLSQIVPLSPLTPGESIIRKFSRNCHICRRDFENGEKRVIDHCHLSGKYRGPAHNSCNLNFKIPLFIPVFFHNFTSYDSHLFIKDLSIVEGEIKVIPLNKEKYISLSKIINLNNTNIELRFLDSFRFMASSLDELSKNLNSENLLVTKKVYSEVSKFDLVRRKGVFPYDYLNHKDKLNEQQLPARENFFNKLTNCECSVSDYEHAQNVWYTFNCQTLRDYMELYLTTDVLLLTDVFENFRKICKSIHKLDPCQYYTAPGLSWDAMLLSTKIELELLTDITMHSFIQRGIRGGLVQCCKRYSVANNKYMKEKYDMNKPDQYLMYVDANNLYGWAMSESLPQGGFKWVNDINSFDVGSVNASSPIGYILEVDLEYPRTLHNLHNDLPFCPENKKMVSGSQVKLIADLNPKTKYIILDRHLKQCLENGLVLKKIHRILQFNQSPWLKTYIDLNNKHRTIAKNTFEKNFFKLLNNAVYGKTMENVDKRKDVKIVTEWESRLKHLGARALIAKPNFHSVSQFSDDMFAIQMSRVHTVYNKPLYLGFCVLELSKWKMYNFHYSYIKPKYQEKVQLNYMDTDSFIYTIETHDFYQDIKPDINDYFDTSEYPIVNKFQIPLKNKKVLGMMKDENNGQIMTEFVGLRSKMYSLTVENGGEVKKSKGVKKSALTKLTISNYKDCLLQRKVLYDSMYMFRSYAHKLYTQHYQKAVLSFADDKRYIREDGINTFAWGHCDIPKISPHV